MRAASRILPANSKNVIAPNRCDKSHETRQMWLRMNAARRRARGESCPTAPWRCGDDARGRVETWGKLTSNGHTAH